MKIRRVRSIKLNIALEVGHGVVKTHRPASADKVKKWSLNDVVREGVEVQDVFGEDAGSKEGS